MWKDTVIQDHGCGEEWRRRERGSSRWHQPDICLINSRGSKERMGRMDGKDEGRMGITKLHGI